jgi:uracil phosphoribosyltransferase
MQGVTVIDHPLVQHKLTIMRDKNTSTAGFRRLLREISLLLGYEVTRDLQLTTTTIETPIEEMEAPVLEGKKLVFASVLRAGNGLLEGLLDLVPAARVAHIGLYRDHDTLEAIEYFFKAPGDLADRLVIVVDPMLATANSATAAIDQHPLPVPAGRAGGHCALHRRPSGRADLYRLHRPAAQRKGLHHARRGRCRRPHVRNEIGTR